MGDAGQQHRIEGRNQACSGCECRQRAPEPRLPRSGACGQRRARDGTCCRDIMQQLRIAPINVREQATDEACRLGLLRGAVLDPLTTSEALHEPSFAKNPQVAGDPCLTLLQHLREVRNTQRRSGAKREKSQPARLSCGTEPLKHSGGCDWRHSKNCTTLRELAIDLPYPPDCPANETVSLRSAVNGSQQIHQGSSELRKAPRHPPSRSGRCCGRTRR
jgi:hypothetical protein